VIMADRDRTRHNFLLPVRILLFRERVGHHVAQGRVELAGATR
jgi:hypothetical protein